MQLHNNTTTPPVYVISVNLCVYVYKLFTFSHSPNFQLPTLREDAILNTPHTKNAYIVLGRM